MCSYQRNHPPRRKSSPPDFRVEFAEFSDKEVLEKVQIKAVNLITGLKGKTYLEKLHELGLLTLDQRRKRFDLIQTFKIIRGYYKV